MERKARRMTNFERDVIDRLGRIETKIDHDYRTLHGSISEEGLVSRVGKLESRMQTVTEYSALQKRFWVTVAGLVGMLFKIAVDFVLALVR